MIRHLVRASLRDGVQCPDCKQGTITRADACTRCGLPWSDLEDAAAFLDGIKTTTKGKKK